MHYAYIIRSKTDSSRTYIGYTNDLRSRIDEQNAGKSPHTRKHLPWKLEFYATFPTKKKALDFETYLKSHSGKAFAAKRLL